MDIPAITGLFDKVLAKGRKTLTEVEGYEVLCHCGIQTPAHTVVTSGTPAGDFAAKLFSRGVRSVVAKVVSPDVPRFWEG